MTRPFPFKAPIYILILLLLVIIPIICQADYQVTLQWDANNPAPEGYQVYGREEGQNYDYDNPWWQGDQTFTQCTLDGLDESKTYFFVVRAYAGDDVSGDSNEVRYAYADGTSSDGTSSDGTSSDGTSSGGSSSLDSNTAGSAGGGSGGGCFIQSLNAIN
jgi:chitinase